jgi:hypothetical protein
MTDKDDPYAAVSEEVAERIRRATAAELTDDEKAAAREFGMTDSEYAAWTLKDSGERNAALEKLKPPAG